jgi:putative sterol carrier protein
VARLGIQVDGPGGGQWELSVREGQLVAVDDGVSRRSTAVFHVHSANFRSMVDGELSAAQAVASGRVRIEGNGMDRDRLEAILQAAATRPVAEVAR